MKRLISIISPFNACLGVGIRVKSRLSFLRIYTKFKTDKTKFVKTEKPYFLKKKTNY